MSKTYGEIWNGFFEKFVAKGILSEHEAKRIHLKWKKIASER
jgi:hypothetical protein